MPEGNRLHPSAQQAQHAKQNGLEICCAIIGGHSGIGSRPKGGLPGGSKKRVAEIFFKLLRQLPGSDGPKLFARQIV